MGNAQKKEPKEKKKLLIKEGVIHFGERPGEEPYLIGSQCAECGAVAFPKRTTCLACLKDNTMKEIPLSRQAVIDSYAIVWQGAPGFDIPYIQAWVRLPEGPKIFTQITGCEPKDGVLRMGQEVEMVVGKVRVDEQGNEIIAWKFRPVTRS